MLFPSYFSTLPVLYAIVDAAAIVPQVENSAKDTVIIVKEREVFNIPAQVALTQGALKGGNAEVSVTTQCTGKEQLTANSVSKPALFIAKALSLLRGKHTELTVSLNQLVCTDEKCKGEEKIRKCTAVSNNSCLSILTDGNILSRDLLLTLIDTIGCQQRLSMRTTGQEKTLGQQT